MHYWKLKGFIFSHEIGVSLKVKNEYDLYKKKY